MPNWVKNLVYARHKTEELIAAFKGKNAYGEEKEVTFNAIVPTPGDVYLDDIGANAPANNWYVFNNTHWGTKWDACDGEVCYDHVEFNTAWSTPDPIIEELAKKLNDAIICVYADEDIGSNCGAYVYFPDEEEDEDSEEEEEEVDLEKNCIKIDPADMFAAYVHYGDEPGTYVKEYLDWNYPEDEE